MLLPEIMDLQPLLLGVDVGTSAVKAVLYDLDGVEYFSTRREVSMATPHPGWAEQDAGALWHALLAVLTDAASAVQDCGRLTALALATQAGSVVPVDAAGAPLAPLITWLDTRAQPIVDAWNRDGSAARIRHISGWRPHPGLPLATLAWMTRHRPDATRNTTRFLDVHGFLLQRLTGRAVTDFSGAAEMMLLDRATASWSDELCVLAGVRHEQLPELAPAGTLAARLLPEVAAATGLPVAIPIVMGGHDQCSAALGMGVTTPGQLMLASGTAWVLTALTPDLPVEQVPDNMELNVHITPGLHTVSQLLGGFGAMVEWWLKMVLPFTSRAERYAAFDEWLATSKQGANDLLFLPLGGSVHMERGAALGGFVGLRLDHTHADMARAIAESVAYELRWALDTLTAAHILPQSIWMSGGATQNPLWPTILADVTGISLYVAQRSDWPARGAAILAGMGCGLLGSSATATLPWRPRLMHQPPDRKASALHAARYAAHREMVARLSTGQG